MQHALAGVVYEMLLQGNACNFPAIAVAFNAYTAPFCDHNIPFSLTIVPSSHVGCCTGETFVGRDLQKRVKRFFILHVMYADLRLYYVCSFCFGQWVFLGLGLVSKILLHI